MAIARPIPAGMSADGKTLRANLLADYGERRKSLREFDFQKPLTEIEPDSQIRCKVLSFW